MKNKVKILTLAAACACLALPNARANTVTLDVGLASTDVVGEDVLNGNFTAPQGGQETRDVIMANTIIHDYNVGSATAPYYISGNSFTKPLPSVITAGDIITPKSGINFANDGNVTITLSAPTHYLIAAYDGPNSGAVLWDIAGLAAGTVIEIPANAQPNAGGTDMIDGKYGITTWSIFDATPPTVPDGGMTVLLLGTALSGLGLIRRKLS